MTDEHFIYLSSGDSMDHFVNSPSSFTVVLPEQLHLEGSWACALTQIDIPGNFSATYKGVYLCNDIVQESIVHGGKRPVLARIPILSGKRRVAMVISTPQYIPLIKNNLTTIRMQLIDEQDKLVRFTGGLLFCQLHLVRKT
jgi:hypothetical protein